MNPIVGVRFSSLEIKNYDLCESCNNMCDHVWPMIMIKTPHQPILMMDKFWCKLRQYLRKSKIQEKDASPSDRPVNYKRPTQSANEAMRGRGRSPQQGCVVKCKYPFEEHKVGCANYSGCKSSLPSSINPFGTFGNQSKMAPHPHHLTYCPPPPFFSSSHHHGPIRPPPPPFGHHHKHHPPHFNPIRGNSHQWGQLRAGFPFQMGNPNANGNSHYNAPQPPMTQQPTPTFNPFSESGNGNQAFEPSKNEASGFYNLNTD